MKYRMDKFAEQLDGSINAYASWIGGPSLSAILKCRIHLSDKRLSVYISGEPDTYFSIPAYTRCKGKYVKGYITSDEMGNIFHAMDSHKERLV